MYTRKNQSSNTELFWSQKSVRSVKLMPVEVIRKLQLRNKDEKGQRCSICKYDYKEQYLRLCIVGVFKHDFVCIHCKKQHNLSEL